MVELTGFVVLTCITLKGTGDIVEQSEAVNRITEILSESKIGVLSTAQNNKPNARYMWFYNDGLTLYAKTNDKSPKYDELKDNPHAHVLLGFHDSQDHAFVEVYGNVERIDDQELIDWLWEKRDKEFFDSKESPHLKVLKIIPEDIKIMNDDEYGDVTLSL
ncbi:General stress protein 26 [Salinicoccus halodurans]|uniref:General stress protein 26 n=1 Tax=Salinicoccus halodurans TaxID=407035 RepID=A0AA94HH37_9STAP|nr:General stress protein 26 [Salinicoccus halodurans]